MAAPTIISVVYFDPWAPKPPWAEYGGLTTKVKENSSGLVLAAQMRRDGVLWGETHVAPRATTVNILPPSPLLPSNAYEVLVQLVPPGTPPASVSWKEPSTFSAAPVLPAGMRILEGEFDGAALTLTWEGGFGPGAVPGAYIQLLDERGVIRLSKSQAGGRVETAFKPTGQGSYNAYVRALSPLAAGPETKFQEPFSYGSPSPPLPLPVVGPQITAASYDGELLTVEWKPVPVALPVPDREYTLHLLKGTEVLAAFPAGSTGARAEIGPEAMTEKGLILGGRARFGPLTGPLSTVTLPPFAPAPEGAAVEAGEAGEVKVSVMVPRVTSPPIVELLLDGAVAETAAPAKGAPATFDIADPAGARVQARVRLTTEPAPVLTGPPGAPLDVLAHQPEIEAAEYDGARLRVVLCNAVPGAAGYTLHLAGGRQTSITAAATGPVLEAAADLDLGASWEVSVQPWADNSMGIRSPARGLAMPPVAPPVIRSVSYDGEEVRLRWESATLPGLSGYTVNLAGAEKDAYATGLDSQIAFPLPPAAAVSGTTVTVTGTSPTRATAPSAEVPVPLPAPAAVVESVSYDGKTIELKLLASPPAGVTAAVFVGPPAGRGDAVVSPSAPTKERSISIPADASKFTPGTQYSLALTFEPDAEAPTWGEPAWLVIGTPKIGAAAVRGGAVEVAWEPAAGAPSARIELLDQTAGSTVAAVESSSPRARLEPATPLDPAHAYTVRASGLRGAASGPPATLAHDLVLSSPAVKAVVYAATASGFEVEVEAKPDPSPPAGAVARLLRDDRVVAEEPLDAGTARFLRATLLEPGFAWAVDLLYRAGSTAGGETVSGPPSDPVPIPLAAPRVTAARFEADEFHVEWEAAAEPAPGGALLTVTRVADGEEVARKEATGCSADIAPAGTIDPAEEYALRIAPTLGAATGLAGPPLSLIVAPPTPAGVSCDGEQAVVAVASLPAGAAGTVVRLLRNGKTVASAPGGTGGGFLPIGRELPQAPAPAPVLSAVVLATAGVASGPPSEPLPVLTEAPVLQDVALAAGKITGTTGTTGPPQLEEPKVVVAAYREGAMVGEPAAGPLGSFEVPAPEAAGQMVLRAWFQGSSAGAAVEGPLCSPVPVLSKAPRLLEARLAGSSGHGQDWKLNVNWELYEPVAGCDLKVVQGSKTLLDLPGVRPPVEAKLTSGPKVKLDSATPLTLSITPHGGFGTGPTAWATLLAQPLKVTAFVDGERVSGTWDAPSLAGSLVPDAYRLCLLRQEGDLWMTVARSQVVTALAGSLPLPADAAAVYGIGVEVCFGAAWSFATGVTPIPRAAPELEAVRVTLPDPSGSAKCSLSWAWPGGEPPVAPALTGYSVVLLEEGAERVLGTAGATASSAEVDLPGGIGPGARVAVRATAQEATGPHGEAAPLWPARPAVSGAAGTAAGVAVDFDAAAVPAPRFLVTLQTKGALVAKAFVRGSPGAVPFAAASDGVPYEVTVAAASEDGTAVGVASDPLAVLLRPPALAKPVAAEGSVELHVTPPDAGGVETTAYKAEVALDGVVVAVAGRLAPSEEKLTVPVGSQVDAAASCAVRVFPLAGSATGPPAELPVLLAAPVVARATARQAEEGLQVELAVDASRLTGEGLGFEARLLTDRGPSEVARVESDVAVIAVPAGARTCAATARAVEPAGAVGPWSAPVVVPLAAPAVSLVDWDGEAVTLEWSAANQPAEVDRYRVVVGSGLLGAETTAVTVNGTSATVRLLEPALSEIWVRALAPAGEGPAGEALTVPLSAPVVVKSTTSPADGEVTVEWAPPPDASAPDSYLVQVYVDGQPWGKPLKAEGTSVALAKPPPLESEAAVAVAALWQQGEATLLGPYGQRQALASAPARLLEAESDGLTAAARWEPVTGATGYRLAVVSGEPGKPVGQGHAGAGEAFARFPVTLDDAGQGYAMTIQPELGDSTGPASSQPLFEPGFYLTTSSGSPAIPVVLRADDLPIAARPVKAYLSGIGTLKRRIAPVRQEGEKPPFTIEANPDGGSSARFPYLLIIDNGALAFGSEEFREPVATLYGMLLLEAEEEGATPRGILAIQETIARLMPQTPKETLFYSYGLSGRGTVDLRPGTILRVAFSEYDATPTAQPENWASGYAGGAAVDYEVGDCFDPQGNWMVGFDAFVSWLTASSWLTVLGPEHDDSAAATPAIPGIARAGFPESGAAEAADLAYSQFQQPFHRLFVPQELQPATPPAEGNTGRQFAIAAAATWKEIESASTVPSATVPVAYFRGRAVVKLCIRVTVGGAERVVPVGTTLGNLLDQSADRSPVAPVPLRGLTVERSLGPAVLDPAAPFAAGRRERLRLDWKGLVTWAGGDALSLPVLHGDRIELGAR